MTRLIYFISFLFFSGLSILKPAYAQVETGSYITPEDTLHSIYLLTEKEHINIIVDEFKEEFGEPSSTLNRGQRIIWNNIKNDKFYGDIMTIGIDVVNEFTSSGIGVFAFDINNNDLLIPKSKSHKSVKRFVKKLAKKHHLL